MKLNLTLNLQRHVARHDLTLSFFGFQAVQSEEEVCPSVATKPVLATLGQAVREQQARAMMDDIMAGGGDRRSSGPKPPRPPPASPTKSAVSCV